MYGYMFTYIMDNLVHLLWWNEGNVYTYVHTCIINVCVCIDMYLYVYICIYRSDYITDNSLHLLWWNEGNVYIHVDVNV
jgi:hypothetical protein